MSVQPGALVSTLSLRPLLVELQHRGVDTRLLLSAHGVQAADVTEPLTRVPENVLWEIWSDAVEQTGDPALGITVGCHFEPTSLGMLGHIIANSATVGDSVRRWQEFTGLIDDQPFIQLTRQGPRARLEFRRRPDVNPEHNRALVEFTVFSALRLLAYLQGRGDLLPTTIQRLCFRHPRPPEHQLTAYREHLGETELAFGQPANAIEIDAAILDQPVVYADAEMLALMSERARQQLRNQHRGHFVVLRVQQALRAHLGNGQLSLEAVAADLAMSRSTLQRQLSEAGVSFRSLLEDVRKNRAFELLRNPAEPIENVAIALGYAETAAFNHAFKRWTGLTPSSWREQIASAD